MAEFKDYNHFLIQLFAIGTFTLFHACTQQEEQQTIRVESISISQADMTMVEGESTILTAIVLPEDAEDKTIKWSSSDESKVMVASSGKAVAMGIGQAVVTAQAGDAKDFITITVVAKTIAVTSISINPTELTIKVGETGTLTPEITPQEATNKRVTWASSNVEVATVKDGTVTGIKAGSVTITATTDDGGHKGECVVTVKNNLAPSVTVGAENISAVSAILKGKANLESTASSDLKVGFQYSKSAGILPSNSTTIEASDADSDYNYCVGITGLEPDTKYYFRSFVRQNGQDSFGETKEFTTKELPSLLHTKEATAVSAVSASLNADLDMADVQFKEKSVGFYWGDAAESLTNKVSASEGDGSISADISELAPSKQYYYQSFIFLDGIELRESVLSFTTKGVDSLLETNVVSNIEATSAVLHAKLDLTDVKYESISYGFYWGDAESSINNCIVGSEIVDHSYTGFLSNLPHNTQHWYKAYATIDSQSFYGDVMTFTSGVVPVESVSLDKTDYTFNTIGNTLTLKANVLPADATNKVVEWSSDKESVATVDQNGTVKAIGNGTAIITVMTEDQGKTATCSITVAQLITSISLDETSLTLSEGEETTLNPTVNPDNASDKSLTWTSSDESVATVDDNGKVTAVSKGTTTIKVTANDGSGKYASCSVTVKRLVSSITLDKTSITMFRWENVVKETITASVLPSTANNTSVTWASSDTAVATVSSSGIVTGKSRGNAIITVSAIDGSGVIATCEVEVRQYVTSITLKQITLSLYEGHSGNMSIISIEPNNANDKSLTWSSSNESIATVDSEGMVTAVSEGTAIIRAVANDGSETTASCKVTVLSAAIDLGLPSGIKWACFNIGASQPEEYGDYYSWGETETKSTYNWSTYKFGSSSSGPFSKYNTDSAYGSVDDKTVLEESDDVAQVKLGGSWRMPTQADWKELKTECSWLWTTLNGVKGYMVYGSNGNSIFLPASGYRLKNGLYAVGQWGYYWSSSLITNNPYSAWGMCFDYGSVLFTSDNRTYGKVVRPVIE